ncbi:MAG: hypothetical protein ACREK8_07320 [Gemmatimonadales bacterium]
MPATLNSPGLKAGDGFGDFMRFTSDDPPDDSGSSRPDPGDARVPVREGGNSQASPDAPVRTIRFTGARSTGRH